MTLEKAEQWVLPEKMVIALEAQVERARQGASGPSDVFGAYHLLAAGKKPVWEKGNDITDDREAESYAKRIEAALAAAGGVLKNRRVLDVGCGLGAVTDALRRVLKAEVQGMDMSKDAVAYAAARYPESRFENQTLDKSCRFTGPYGLIHCREFEPFCHTADAATHLFFLRVFAPLLVSGGRLFITLEERPRCLAQSAPALTKDLAGLGLEPFSRMPAASGLAGLLGKITGRASIQIHWTRKI